MITRRQAQVMKGLALVGIPNVNEKILMDELITTASKKFKDKDFKGAEPYLVCAAELGDQNSAKQLVTFYERGAEGISPEPDKAAKFKNLAEYKNPEPIDNIIIQALDLATKNNNPNLAMLILEKYADFPKKNNAQLKNNFDLIFKTIISLLDSTNEFKAHDLIHFAVKTRALIPDLAVDSSSLFHNKLAYIMAKIDNKDRNRPALLDAVNKIVPEYNNIEPLTLHLFNVAKAYLKQDIGKNRNPFATQHLKDLNDFANKDDFFALILLGRSLQESHRRQAIVHYTKALMLASKNNQLLEAGFNQNQINELTKEASDFLKSWSNKPSFKNNTEKNYSNLATLGLAITNDHNAISMIRNGYETSLVAAAYLEQYPAKQVKKDFNTALNNAGFSEFKSEVISEACKAYQENKNEIKAETPLNAETNSVPSAPVAELSFVSTNTVPSAPPAENAISEPSAQNSHNLIQSKMKFQAPAAERKALSPKQSRAAIQEDEFQPGSKEKEEQLAKQVAELPVANAQVRREGEPQEEEVQIEGEPAPVQRRVLKS